MGEKSVSQATQLLLAPDRLQTAQQYGGGFSLGLGDKVQAAVHAIDQVQVGMARRAEHDGIAGCFVVSVGVGRLVDGTDVGLHLRNAADGGAAVPAADQILAQQLPGDGQGIPGVAIAICLTMFALSTVLTWALYGSRCIEYLLGYKASKVYQVIFCLFACIAGTVELSLAWNIADTLNGLMAIPNLIAVALLSPVVIKLTKEYFAEVKAKKVK